MDDDLPSGQAAEGGEDGLQRVRLRAHLRVRLRGGRALARPRLRSRRRSSGGDWNHAASSSSWRTLRLLLERSAAEPFLAGENALERGAVGRERHHRADGAVPRHDHRVVAGRDDRLIEDRPQAGERRVRFPLLDEAEPIQEEDDVPRRPRGRRARPGTPRRRAAAPQTGSRRPPGRAACARRSWRSRPASPRSGPRNRRAGGRRRAFRPCPSRRRRARGWTVSTAPVTRGARGRPGLGPRAAREREEREREDRRLRLHAAPPWSRTRATASVIARGGTP